MLQVGELIGGGTDVDKLVGANIQRLRTAKGMSQADLATALTKLGGRQLIHQQTIAKLEKGTRSLKYVEAVLIAELLTVDLHDLSAGQIEAVAARLERLEGIRHMTEELDVVAKHLAYHLVMLAAGLGSVRNKERAEDETRTPEGESVGWLDSQVVDTLQTNWGRVLNERIHLAMQQHPYLAEIKSEFAASTYGEVLKRVSESPIVWPEDRPPLPLHG
jgi:transcriptional regulator with XRE-family HTH domain